MNAKFLTDEEMADLESGSKTPRFISDEEMAQLEGVADTPNPSFLKNIQEKIVGRDAANMPNETFGQNAAKVGMSALGAVGFAGRFIGAATGQGDIKDAGTNILRRIAEPLENSSYTVNLPGGSFSPGKVAGGVVRAVGDPTTFAPAGVLAKFARPAAAIKQAEMAKTTLGNLRPSQFAQKVSEQEIKSAPIGDAAVQTAKIEKLPFAKELKGLNLQENEWRELDTKAPEDAPSFNDYAKASIGNSRNIALAGPDALMNKQATTQLKEIERIKSATGKEIGDVIDRNSHLRAQGFDLRGKVQELSDKYIGGEAHWVSDENGKVRAAVRDGENSAVIETGEVPVIAELMDRVSTMPLNPSLKYLQSFKQALNKYKSYNQGGVNTTSPRLSAVVSDLADDVNNQIKLWLPKADKEQYVAANEMFGKVASVESNLERVLGAEINKSGLSRNGASIMKRAVNSTADAGIAQIFRDVEELTGYNLYRDAMYGKLAMRYSGDINQAQKAIPGGPLNQEFAGIAGGIAGKSEIVKMAGGIGKAIAGRNQLQQLSDWYSVRQGLPKVKIGERASIESMAKDMVKGIYGRDKDATSTIGKIGNALRSERGAVGGVNPQVKIENFKNWFGDWEKAPEKASKVVGYEGRPLVVYHGTPVEDLEAFDFSYSGTGSSPHGHGVESMLFTSSKDDAKNYGNVKDVYLDMKKPYVYDAYKDLEKWKESEFDDIYNSVEEMVEKEYGGDLQKAWDYDNTLYSEFDKAKKQGDKYDGVVVKWGGITDKNGNEYGDIYMPFSPEQIKSATGNSGKIGNALRNERGAVGGVVNLSEKIDRDMVKHLDFSKFKNADDFAQAELDYADNVRYYDRRKSGMSEYGHAMFANDKESVSHYSRNDNWFIPNPYRELKIVKPDEIRDDFIKRLQENEHITGKFRGGVVDDDGQEVLETLKETAEKLADELNPDDIVNSAATYDDRDLVGLISEVLDSRGIDGIETRDGLVLFNEEALISKDELKNLYKSATGNSGKFDPKNPDIRGSGAVPLLGLTAAASGGTLAAVLAAAKKKKEREMAGKK